MVADLLEISRADTGSVDVFLEEVSVSELVQRSVEAGVGHLDGQGHGSPPAVHIDPGVRSWRVGADKRSSHRPGSWSRRPPNAKGGGSRADRDSRGGQ